MIELSHQQLKELREKELDILRAFIFACKSLNLNYYILEGTLLGAVRHHGFIPWDDDIDVGLLRKDYEIFLQNCQTYLPKEYFLQSYITDPEFPANFAKIRNSNTTFVESSIKNCHINHGIYIDIFPLDYYPSKHKIIFNTKKFLAKLRITDAYTPGKMKYRTKMVRLISRVLYPTITDAIVQRDILFKSIDKGTHLINHCSPWGSREVVPAHWYGTGVPLIFEGLEVNAPTHYHEWLTQVYGDYMQLPPPEQQIPHHYVDAFDLTKPYTNHKNS